ncbi:MAG: hypothetical protein IPI26_08965 [Elusimicrobia bacterium]|nr:hypothetical protein [Elusimicrobiota bacterium]
MKAMACGEFPSHERNSWLLFLASRTTARFSTTFRSPASPMWFENRFPACGRRSACRFILLSYQPGKNWRLALSAFGPTHISAEGERRLETHPAWAYARSERNPPLSEAGPAGRTAPTGRSSTGRDPRLGVQSPLGGNVSRQICRAGLDFRERFYESKDANRSESVLKPSFLTPGSVSCSYPGVVEKSELPKVRSVFDNYMGAPLFNQ